jgi:hypothetical protein
MPERTLDEALHDIAEDVAQQADPKVVLRDAYDAVIADVADKDKELATNLKRKRGAIARRR